MIVLGIETSCDETSVALVDSNKNIIAHKILSQIKEHEIFGGVVPEIAARAHIQYLPGVIDECLKEANLDLKNIDAVAVTAGPGLIGGVLVGLMAAKGIAASLNKPLIAVNHLEGHALTVRLTEDVKFPYLLLLVSGGHCQILLVKGVGSYVKLGSTLDDAAGEAFDKVAKMLDIGYPGGPAVEQRALLGNHLKFNFPKSLVGREGCDFSFSGLKTAVRRTLEDIETIDEQTKNDICASFQYTVGEIIKDRLTNAIEIANEMENIESIVVAGGVAANKYLNKILTDLAENFGLKFYAPPLKLCTDNGAMIAWAGVERFKLGLVDNLEVEPKATWPLY